MLIVNMGRSVLSYRARVLGLVLCGFLCLACVYAGDGREYKFRTMSPSGGLGYDGVKSIIQDRNGFIWIVTADELFHFDGFNYKRYSKRMAVRNEFSSSVYFQSVFSDSKRRLYLATSQGVFLYNEDSDMFERVYGGAVTRIYEDGSGSLWFTGDELGLYNPETGDYTHFDMMDSESTYMNSVLCSAPGGRDIYIGTDWGKIFCIKGRDREIDVVYAFPERTRIAAARFVGDRLWVLSETKGLFVLNVREKRIEKRYDFLLQEAENKVPAKCLYVDNQGRMWIGTQQGLYLFDPEREVYRLFTRDVKEPFSLVNNSVWTIAGDEQGNLWIGTYSGGISYLALNETTGFDTQTLDQYGFTPRPISAFVRQGDRLWLGTEGGGLYYYDRDRGIVHAYSHRSGSNSLSYDYVKTLLADGSGNLWIGMYRGGIDCLDTRSGVFRNYNSNSSDRRVLSNEISKVVAEADSGMWVVYQVSGTMLTYFPFGGERSNHYFLGNENIGYENKRIIDVCRSKDGYLWLASYDDIFRFDIRRRKSETVPVSRDGSYNIRSLFFDDRRGSLWIGTQNKGLVEYCVATGKCTVYDAILKFGLITINSISADSKGNLWLGSNSGLFRFDKSEHSFLRYDNNDAIQGLVFYPHAVYSDTKGEIYFGGTEGFTCIEPGRVHINGFRSRVLIADFQLNNESVFNGSSFCKVVSQLSKGERVELSHNQNNVSIELSSTNYVLPLKNRYRYRLKGYNDEWVEVDVSRRYISYPKLPAGKYVFEAMASNNDGVWGEPRSVTFVVKAAPWASWWAYAFYACLFLLALYLYNRNRLRNHRLENEIYLAACRKRDQEESHQARLRFFTNITHDFKTPLTMILGTIDSMEEDELRIPEGYMQALKSNSTRLLKLVNEVIDFRMVEKGMMSVKLGRGDLNALVHSCASELREYAIKKEIVFRIMASASVPEGLLFDYQMVEKIVLNLLDNAVKYTSAGGRVCLETYSDVCRFETEYAVSHTEGELVVGRHYFGFVVKDTGIGISADSISKVFDRFYRVDDEDGEEHLGSGIGLALVRSLVLLHGGFVTISSERGKGTDIVVGLPLKEGDENCTPVQAEAVTEEIILPVPASAGVVSDFALDYAVSDKRTLLLVEDNEDLRAMIEHRLSPYFTVVPAGNGREALGVLESREADLILSDWMMPLMDGVELCREVKGSERWSHIPFVLMTVRSGAENRLEGCTSGAEAYVEKPLDFKLLVGTLNNLLALREGFRRHYAENYFIDTGERVKNKAGNDFMERLTGILRREIASRDVNIEDIAREMMMSRRKLFSLVKANTGKSVVEFIRSYKMRYAARLMVEENLAIKEIPQLVGIESASYFTKAFKAEFGDTPSAFLAKMRGRG